MFQSPIKGKLQGLARFVSGGETDPLVMTFDSPQAPKLYNILCGCLDNYNVPYHKDYGFIPHMTLAYIPRDGELPIDTIEPIEINFSEVYYVDGDVWYPVDLVGYENKGMTGGSTLNLSADEIKDLALWYDRSRQWFIKGKGAAVDWENKHLPETIAAPIRLKLAEAKNEADIAQAFYIGETTTAAPAYREPAAQPEQTEAIKALAHTIELAIAAAKAEPTVTPAPVFNMTMPNISLTAQMPELGQPSVTFAPVIQPSEVINQNNFTANVEPTPVTVENQFSPNNNITAVPSEVVIQKDGKHEATIERDASGKITKVKSK
jgi:hypothetical protein